MSNLDLFNSKSDPIPQIRPDVDVIPINNNGDSYLYFHDIRGYVPSDFALDRSAGVILFLLDGRKSINDLQAYLGNGITTDILLEYVQFLDENRLLHSPHYKNHADEIEQKYEKSPIHQSVTAGGSYPSDTNELLAFLDEAFANYGADSGNSASNPVKALYAPHIDPRIGMKTYVESFQVLRQMKPGRVVILATSHYAGLHAKVYQNKPFIVSNKNFETPLGTIPADRDAIDFLAGDAEIMGLSTHDRAHRIEHSIELHLLFLSYIWQHDYSVIPILVGGFDELFYMDETNLGKQIDTFSKFLRNQFGQNDDTLFLISGDLAHVGKKFGDNRPAAAMKNEVELFDEQFLTAAKNGSTQNMLKLMKHDYDPYRICGFPPLYTFLKAFPDLKGQTISYDRWNQTEAESAVTFGSILYE